jgi:hypothetical protein
LLKYSWGNENAVVARALERVTVGSPETAAAHLIEALRRTPDEVRMRGPYDRRTGVVEMIRRLGPPVKGTAPALRAILAEPPAKDPSDFLRPAAAEALWHALGTPDDALAALIECLSEQLPSVHVNAGSRRGHVNAGSRRGRAAVALGRVGAPALTALPALRAELEKAPTPYDRLDAAEAVWRLTGDAKAVLPLLKTVLQTKLEGEGNPPEARKDAHVRAIAIMALMGAAAKDAAGALAEAIRAEDEFNARHPLGFHILKNDEEDEDPDRTELIRRDGLPVLQQLDPTAAKALAAPVKMP